MIIEDVQKKFTTFLSGLYNTPYADRFITLKHEALELRRMTADLAFLSSMIKGFVNTDCSEYSALRMKN